MSLHSDLTTYWLADLRTALGASEPSGGHAVYMGVAPQAVPNVSLDVWVEGPVSDVDEGRHALAQGRRAVRYVVHLRAATNPGAKRNWDATLTTITAHQETLVQRYRGLRVLASSISSVICTDAEARQPELVDDGRVLDAPVEVTWHVA